MNIFTKINQKFKMFDKNDWIMTALWVISLIMMFAFIGVAAGLDQTETVIVNGTKSSVDSKLYADSVAGVSVAFVALLFASIIYTVWIKYKQKIAEGGGK